MTSQPRRGPRVLVLHGPSLGALGTREPAIYGTTTLREIDELLRAEVTSLGGTMRARQSNHEGVIVDEILAARTRADGILLNAAAYTHTSVAIRDAILAAAVPTVEIHLTNPDSREPFRHVNLIAGVCVGTVRGFGPFSYALGARALIGYLTGSDGQSTNHGHRPEAAQRADARPQAVRHHRGRPRKRG